MRNPQPTNAEPGNERAPADENVPSGGNSDSPRPLAAHLAELRTRIVVSLVSTAIATAAAWWQYPLLFRLVKRPLEAAAMRLPVEPVLQAWAPLEPFMFVLKLGIVSGLVLASPVLLFETWMFLRLGLTAREKRVLAPIFALGLLFFIAGAAAAYFWVAPTALYYLASFAAKSGILYNLRLSEYTSFLINLLLAFGIAFELPLVMLGLSASGILAPTAFMRPIRYVIAGAFVIGALLTPPDVVTQIIMAVMLIALYFLGILFARIGYRASLWGGGKKETGG